MEHSATSSSRAGSPRGSSNDNSSPREKRKLEVFVTESGETWEFERPVKKSRSSGQYAGSNTSTAIAASGSPPRNQRPTFSATSPARSKRSRDPSEDDFDAQLPSPKRQMTSSVTDLGDHAAALRRARWLSTSRPRRQGAAASRSRSPPQNDLFGLLDAASGTSQSAGPAESEELPELPDYESDEEFPVGQHAVNNLEQVAPFQESAMTFPPASYFQEGQESEMPVVASIETDPDTESQIGSSHYQVSETVVGSEYVSVAGNRAYEAASTTRPVVWSSLDPRLASISRSPSPVTRYKLARANSSGSESDDDSPGLLRSRFAGFAQAAATVVCRSEAQQQQQQSAREPGNTSTSASNPGPVTAVDTVNTTISTKEDRILSSIKESDIEFVESNEIDTALSPVKELHHNHPTTSPVEELSPSVAQSPTSPSTTMPAEIIDEPSQQLLSELAAYIDDERNLFKEEVKVEEPFEVKLDESSAKSHANAASIQASVKHSPIASSRVSNHHQFIPAPFPPNFTEDEIQHMMAVHAADGGPSDEEIEVLRILMEGLEDRMEIDGEVSIEQFNSAQNDIRERLRRERDAEVRKATVLKEARHKYEIDRKHFDEAPDTEPADGIASDEDNDEDFTLLLAADDLQTQRDRVQAALQHWTSCWPDPSSLPSEHWQQETRNFAINQINATNPIEKSYWANRGIQADCYAKGEIRPGKLLNLHIRLTLIDWKRSITTSEEESAAFADQVSQIQLTEDDQEAPLRAKLARFLSELPPDLDQKVTDILNITNPGRAIVKSAEGNDLTRRDFATLLHSANYRTGEPEGWLNDEIINGFFTAMCNAMNDKAGHTKGKVPPYASYITGWYSSVTKKGITAIERWSRRKGIKGDKLLQCKRIFFPVNPGNHWSLLVICPDIHTIEYLDSLDYGNSDFRKSTKYINLGREWLRMELGNQYVESEWKALDRRSSIQNNGSDCGVFTCLNGFASALELKNPTKEFGPEQIPYARRAMVSMFNLGGFNKHFEL